jgi:hypothetical protein
MIFHKIAVRDVHDRTQATSQYYHKNGDCMALANSEAITLTQKQSAGFDPCPICYENQ